MNMRDQLRNQMQQWRQAAILDAVADLLASEGCHRFTMEDVAKRVGIAKGSLYLHTNARADLVQEVLALWERDVASPTTVSSKPPHTQWHETCTDLFEGVGRGDASAHSITPAIPCCLHTSPCPYGWMDRWDNIVRSRSLLAENATSEERGTTRLFGEVIQAIATTPSVRLLLDEGRLSEASLIICRFLLGYQTTPGSPS